MLWYRAGRLAGVMPMNKPFKFIAHPRKQAMHVESRPSKYWCYDLCPVGEEKGKGQKIFFVEETKKGRKAFGKGKSFLWRKEKGWRKRMKIFVGESFLWRRGKTEKEREENIWRICKCSSINTAKLHSKFVWVKNVVLLILLCHLATSRGIGFCAHFF